MQTGCYQAFSKTPAPNIQNNILTEKVKHKCDLEILVSFHIANDRLPFEYVPHSAVASHPA